jgi:hypothetical protein
VSVDEFKKGIEISCKGKSYSEFPAAFRFFIDSCFRTIDVDGKILFPGKKRVEPKLIPKFEKRPSDPFDEFFVKKEQIFDAQI